MTDTFRSNPARKRETNSLVYVHGYSDNTSDGFDGLESKYCRSRQRHSPNLRDRRDSAATTALSSTHTSSCNLRRSQTFAITATFRRDEKLFEYWLSNHLFSVLCHWTGVHQLQHFNKCTIVSQPRALD